MAKKDKKDSSIGKFLDFHMVQPPKPKLNAKKIEALEILMKDEAIRNDLGSKYQNIVDAFKCGKKCKED